MLYILTALTAVLLVTAQALWKKVSHLFLLINKDSDLLPVLSKLIFSWQFIAGAFLYIIATLIYIWLFSKFPYYSVQITLVSFSIILSLLVSVSIFKEGVSTINFLGVLIVMIGIFLVTWKR